MNEKKNWLSIESVKGLNIFLNDILYHILLVLLYISILSLFQVKIPL